MTAMPIVFKREIGTNWRHYSVIEGGRVHLLEMTPALWGGWNVKRYTVQGEDEWPGMDSESIRQWFIANRYDDTEIQGDEANRVVTLAAERAYELDRATWGERK